MIGTSAVIGSRDAGGAVASGWLAAAEPAGAGVTVVGGGGPGAAASAAASAAPGRGRRGFTAAPLPGHCHRRASSSTSPGPSMAGSSETNDVGAVTISCEVAGQPGRRHPHLVDGLDEHVAAGQQVAQLGQSTVAPLGQVRQQLRPVGHGLGDEPIGLTPGLEPRALGVVPGLAGGSGRPRRRPRA